MLDTAREGTDKPLWQILIWAGTRFSLVSCESFVCLTECILSGFLTVSVIEMSNKPYSAVHIDETCKSGS